MPSGVVARSSDIVRLLGDVDASTIARIEAMNARVVEIMEAIQWLWPEDGAEPGLARPTSERVSALVELLSELGDDVEDEDGPAESTSDAA